MAAMRIFDPKCRHHNPYCAPGMKALFTEMAKVQQEMKSYDMPTNPVFKVKEAIVDENMLVVHTTMQSRSKPAKGFRQIHKFRFRRDKVVEYWDVTQSVPD